MDRAVLVYADLVGSPVPVGRLARARRGRESATFEYDSAWLEHAERFALEPALTLGPGPQHTPSGRALFGALGDSAPDRWGRALMRRAERVRAEREGRSPRTLLEVDFLLLVDDEARQGALRFAEREGGPFLASIASSRIPPLVELPKLLHASERVIGETASDEDLRLNPVPLDVRPRILTLAITLDDATANLSLAFEVAEYFGISAKEARRITGEVGFAVSRWREAASRVGVDRGAIDRMASAFEHEDLRQSLAMRG